MDKLVVILLAAGTGKRMNSNVAKQYMLLKDKPVLWYALQAFSVSALVSEIVLVVGKGEQEFIKKEFLEKYNFSKVTIITEGGTERYFSVWNGLKAAKEQGVLNENAYVAIHDGARPFVTEDIICNTLEAAIRYKACVAAVPVKDTIKIADEWGYVSETPRRDLVWTVQTPQVFESGLIYEAYRELIERLEELKQNGIEITDDAMVVETITGNKVKLVKASYENIKITTPEDMQIAESFMERV